MDEVVRQSQERARQVLALVEDLGSIRAAAEQLGLSQQRVYKIIGPGAFRVMIEIVCQDCGRPSRARRNQPPRCPRCREYFAKYGRPWSREAVVSRHRQLRKTHCKNGHPLSGDNLYTSPKGHPLCRACQADRDRRYRQRKAVRRAQLPAKAE